MKQLLHWCHNKAAGFNKNSYRLVFATSSILFLLIASSAHAREREISELGVVETIAKPIAFLTDPARGALQCVYNKTYLDNSLLRALNPFAGPRYYIDWPDNTTPYIASDQYAYRHPVKIIPGAVFCPPGANAKLIETEQINPGEVKTVTSKIDPSWPERALIHILVALFTLLASIGTWIIKLGAILLAPLLGVRSFITNDMVRTGWPFLQGIANLGFIVALLYIAFATTLRLDIGGGVKRLLPRLLIAAVLINFSLVIAGLLIDASRVVMAIMAQVVTGQGLSNIGASLLEGSQLINITFDTSTIRNSYFLRVNAYQASWDIPLKALQAVILIWTLAAGLIIITVGLLVRYIMLILLLIVSPIAYLAYAFPNMGKFGEAWWKKFIQYLLYGPIALFILVLLVRVNSSSTNLLGQNKADTDPLLDAILSIGITAAMCFAAATAGKRFGYIGANATINYLKKAPREIWKRPATAGAIIGGIATGGVGAVALGGVGAYFAKRGAVGTGRRVRDSYREATKPFRQLLRTGEFSKYDKEGKLKPGQRTVGSIIGEGIAPRFISRQGRADRADEIAARNLGTLVATNFQVGHPNYLPADQRAAIAPNRLSQVSITQILGHDNINRIAESTDRTGDLQAIARNRDYLRSLNNNQRATLINAIRSNNNPEIENRDRNSAVERILQTLDDIRRE